MERTHRKLSARFANRLRGDNANGRSDFDFLAGRKVASVALRAHAVFGIAGKARTDPDRLQTASVDLRAGSLVDDLVGRNDRLVGLRIGNRIERGTAKNAIAKRNLDFVAFDDRLDFDAVDGIAVFLGDDHILGNIDKLAGKVTCVSRLERRIGKTLARTVGRNEVLENRQTFTERRGNRTFDDVSRRIRHEAAHAGKLTDLELGATSLRIDEHIDRVEFGRVLVLGRDVLVDRLVEFVADLLGRRRPNIDDLVMTFAIGDDTLLELSLNLLGLGARLLDFIILVGRTNHVLKTHRRAGNRRELISERLEIVDRFNGEVVTGDLVAVENQLADRGLGALVVPEAHLRRPNVVEDYATGCGLDRALVRIAVRTASRAVVGVAEANAGMIPDCALGDAEFDFGNIVEERQVLAGHIGLACNLARQLILLRRDSQEVKTKADVLRRCHDRLARSR